MRHTQSVSIPARVAAEAFTRNRRRASASGFNSLRLGTCQIRIKSEAQGSSSVNAQTLSSFLAASSGRIVTPRPAAAVAGNGKVDSVSGATITAKVFREAIADAIKNHSAKKP
ncbi:FMN-binding protein [Sutterella wadsworthensis]